MVLMELSSAALQLHHYTATSFLPAKVSRCWLNVKTLQAKWLECTGGVIVMGFGFSSSNIWPKLGPGFLWVTSGMWGDVTCESYVRNPTMIWSKIYFFWLALWVRSQEQEDRGGEEKRIKLLKVEKESALPYPLFCINNCTHTHIERLTHLEFMTKSLGKSDSHILLTLSPQQCML